MPVYNGHSLITQNARIPTAKQPNRPISNEGIKVQDSYLSQGNNTIRIANRHIVITTIKQSLKFDLTVTCFDISLVSKILFVCAGKLVYVFNCETNILKNQMGKVGGAVHKTDIRNCALDITGTLGVTCGDDKRIIIWDLVKYKALKVMEGHKGGISQVEFGPGSDTILSSSDDGKVLIWNWKTGTITSSCMRHPSAVRSFDFNYDKPDLVVCGRTDGVVTVWNTKESVKMDEIAPDPTWTQNEYYSGMLDKTKNHCGPILCLKISLDKQLLATCSSDNTCKLWKINTYQKDLLQVKAELKACESVNEILEGYIDVTDDSLDSQLQFERPQTVQLGEVPISSGYHAALRFTFQHEAPVLACAFTVNSDILVTGSLDATCRIWSSRRGEPLFQINMPAPVTSIKVDFNDNLHFGCLNRLLTFRLKPLFKEQDLPNYWQNTEIRKMIDQFGVQQNEKHTVASEQKMPEKQSIALSELKRLIAHGVLLPDSVHDIAAQYTEINARQLVQNMKKFQVTSQQVLRLIANTRFSPKDILLAMSTKQTPQILFALINHGASITSYMLKMGYKMLRLEEDPLVTVDLRSLVHPSSVPHKALAADFDYINWWKRYFPLEEEEYEESDYEDEENELFARSGGREYTQQKGKILHFIPSEQMKIIKDLQSKRDIKPIFLRSLAMGQETGEAYPNFNADDQYDEVLVRSRKPHPSKSERFNESLKGTTLRASQQTTLRQPGQSKFNKDMLMKRKSLYDSAHSFQPNKYFQTRGLNISFATNPQEPQEKESLSDLQIKEFTETLLSTPIVIGQARNESYSLSVGNRTKFKERIFKMPNLDEM